MEPTGTGQVNVTCRKEISLEMLFMFADIGSISKAIE
jgi:hypothetical protein